MWWNVTWTCLHEIHPHMVQCINRKWLSLNSFPSSPCNTDWHQTLVLACNHLTSARTKLSQYRESFTHRQELLWIMVQCALWAIKGGGKRSGRSATQVHTYICSALHSKLQKQQIEWKADWCYRLKDWVERGAGEEWGMKGWRDRGKSSNKKKSFSSISKWNLWSWSYGGRHQRDWCLKHV